MCTVHTIVIARRCCWTEIKLTKRSLRLYLSQNSLWNGIRMHVWAAHRCKLHIRSRILFRIKVSKRAHTHEESAKIFSVISFSVRAVSAAVCLSFFLPSGVVCGVTMAEPVGNGNRFAIGANKILDDRSQTTVAQLQPNHHQWCIQVKQRKPPNTQRTE